VLLVALSAAALPAVPRPGAAQAPSNPVLAPARTGTVIGVISGGIDGTYARIAADLMTVLDDGIGVDLEKDPGEGGLGSVIVRQLAGQFGGNPQYSRRSDGGLMVSIKLPGIEKPS
jgi:two-component sensor histidine kinase